MANPIKRGKESASMRTVAFVNHKGGVGKTACSLAFAEGLHRAGKRVLLIDLDQQMNASQCVGYRDTEGVETVYDLLMSGMPATEAAVPAPFGMIVRGDVVMADAEAELALLDTPLVMLEDALASVPGEEYDYCVIDCPPSLGYVTRNAMVAADDLIVVVQPDEASITGFSRIWESFERIRGNRHLNPDLNLCGILLNGFDWNRRLSRRAVSELPGFASDFNTRLFDTRIRSCEAIRQAQAHAQSIFEYAPDSHAAEDFSSFVDEYLEQEGRAA